MKPNLVSRSYVFNTNDFIDHLEDISRFRISESQILSSMEDLVVNGCDDNLYQNKMKKLINNYLCKIDLFDKVNLLSHSGSRLETIYGFEYDLDCIYPLDDIALNEFAGRYQFDLIILNLSLTKSEDYQAFDSDNILLTCIRPIQCMVSFIFDKNKFIKVEEKILFNFLMSYYELCRGKDDLF